MNYTQFREEMRERIRHALNDEQKVELVKVEKNNGIVLYGITIKKPGCNCVPTVYLEKFYEDYLKDHSWEDILHEFLEIYEEHQLEKIPNLDFFTDYKQIKERLSVMLIHYGKNKNRLEMVPYKRFLDLAQVVYCKIPEMGNENTNAIVLITNEHFKTWNVSKEKLFRDAMRNAQSMMPCHIRSMSRILQEQMPFSGDDYEMELTGEIRKQSDAMLVVSNQQSFYGAVCILYDDVLQHIADENKTDYYILPSSVHETILVPVWIGDDINGMKSMVKEINRTQVEVEEVLSDEIYYFDRLSGKILPVQ